MSDNSSIESKIDALTNIVMDGFDRFEKRFEKIEGRLEKVEFRLDAVERRIDDLAEQIRVRTDLEHRMTRMETKLGM